MSKTLKLRARIRELEAQVAELRKEKALVGAEAFAYRMLLEHQLALAVAAGADQAEAEAVLQRHRRRRLVAVPG